MKRHPYRGGTDRNRLNLAGEIEVDDRHGAVAHVGDERQVGGVGPARGQQAAASDDTPQHRPSGKIRESHVLGEKNGGSVWGPAVVTNKDQNNATCLLTLRHGAFLGEDVLRRGAAR